jgi:hypothetical protein
MPNKLCQKTCYTKKEAKRQAYFRNLHNGEQGGIYFCEQHNYWHLTKNPELLTPNMWKAIRNKKSKY